jgi:alkylhydroperoxidase family enzyme
VRAAGYTDEQIVDMVAETAFGIITNLVNNTSATDLGASFRPMARHRIRA